MSYHLTPRQWQILTLLFAHPLLDRDELAPFLDMQPSSVWLLLKQIARWGCISALPTAAGVRWRVTEKDCACWQPPSKLMCAIWRSPSRRCHDEATMDAPVMMQRGLRWLRQSSLHTAGLYGFFARLTRTANDQQRLCWWETGATCERHYQRQERWHRFKPDALAEYQAQAALTASGSNGIEER